MDQSFDPRIKEGEPTKCMLCCKQFKTRSVPSPSYRLLCLDCDFKEREANGRGARMGEFKNDLKCSKCDQYGAVKMHYYRQICYRCVNGGIHVIFIKGWDKTCKPFEINNVDVYGSIQLTLEDPNVKNYFGGTIDFKTVHIQNQEGQTGWFRNMQTTFSAAGIKESETIRVTAYIADPNVK